MVSSYLRLTLECRGRLNNVPNVIKDIDNIRGQLNVLPDYLETK